MIVRSALIQTKDESKKSDSIQAIKDKAIEKHLKMVGEAAAQGAKLTCFQGIFFGPYFCAEQDSRWYELAEDVPWPTTAVFQEAAAKYQMVLGVPIYEKQITGVY